jgi:hypothetical protein
MVIDRTLRTEGDLIAWGGLKGEATDDDPSITLKKIPSPKRRAAFRPFRLHARTLCYQQGTFSA